MTTHHGGDPARHRTLDDLAAAFKALPPAPRDVGRLVALIRRPGSETRETLDSAVLGVTTGLPGDRWSDPDTPNPDAQLTAMNAAVGELIGNGQSIALYGDNLIVDLALDLDNLPIGSKVRLGACTLEVTPKAHRGCLKYRARFGADALKYIASPTRKDERLRGLYFRVVEAGEVRVGDEIVVLSRA